MNQIHQQLNVSVSPHIRGPKTTASIMWDVAIALLPACGFGVYWFGLKALWVILVTVLTCVLTEYLYQRLMKLPITVHDGSAVVTGLILAANLPATVPLWLPVIGGVFAILVVKQLFGGLGQNFMNPALAARCFLLISFSARMTAFPAVDGVTGPTPLALMQAGEQPELLKLFFGLHSGTIGETCIPAILLGGLYLLIRRVISIRIPLVYVGSFLLFAVLCSLGSGSGLPGWEYLLAQLCSGGLMIGAFFMATDYVTTPITPAGQVVFGVVIGLLTALFRIIGSSAEGVSYAIIIGNMLVPLIEKCTIPRPFGVKRGGKKG